MNSFLLGIPGRAPITQFELQNDYLVTTAENPATIGSIYFSLVQPIGPQFAAGLFFSVYPYTNVEYMAVIGDHLPSQIVSTGFGQNPNVAQLPEIKLIMFSNQQSR